MALARPARSEPRALVRSRRPPLYAEHAADHLAPSRIDALEIKRLVIDAIRATWPLPDDDDEAEDGEDIFAV